MAKIAVSMTEVFSKTMQQILEERIEKCCEKVRVNAINQINEEISEIVAATVIQIFDVCSFDRVGQELVIRIDTSKLLKQAREDK